MKKSISILIILILFGSSCKKKAGPPEPVPPSSGLPSADGSTSNATQFYGIFTTGNYTTVPIGGSAFTTTNARAYFSNQPVAYMYLASSVMVNKIFLNNDSLSYNTSYKYYVPNYPVNLATETWSVNGANGIGSFSYANNILEPTCSGLNTLPDSISKGTGFTVNINNIINSSYGSLIVFDGTGSTSGIYSTPLNLGNNAITVSSTNLSALSTTTNGNIAIVLSNKRAVIFSNKDFQFSRESQYNKHIKIRP